MKMYTDFYAIDIGTSSLKLVSLKESTGGAYEVEAMKTIDLPLEIVGGDFTAPIIKDLAAFKGALQELIKAPGVAKKGAVIGLPDRWVKLYLSTMEITENEKKNSEFLRWRIEKSLPIPEGLEVMVDYQVLSAQPSENGYTCDVIAAAVKKDIIEILSVMTADLKIEVMAFDTSSLGLFNLYEDMYPDKITEQAVVNLHIGNETTVFKAYRNGKLIYERVIEVAGDEFSKIIAELDAVDYKEAAKTKATETFFPTNREEMAASLDKRPRIERIFGNWLRELNVTFRFFQRKFGMGSISEVFLTGGGAMFVGVAGFLSDYLDTNCIVFDPFAALGGEKKEDEASLKQGAILAPCLGLLAK